MEQTNHIHPAFSVNNIPVLFCSDRNYLPYLGVSLRALVDTSTAQNNYDILVIEDGFTEPDKELLQLCVDDFHNVKLRFISNSSCEKFRQKFWTRGHFTESVYYRLFAPSLLEKYDKIVYLDVDTILTSDVAELYSIDIEENLIGGCRDFPIEHVLAVYDEFASYWNSEINFSPELYINSGVLVMNLALMRIENIEQDFISVLSRIGTPFQPDQDILNIVCHGRIKYIDPVWNFFGWRQVAHDIRIQDFISKDSYAAYKKTFSEFKIIHYIDVKKPWNTPGVRYAEYFWNSARKTPFYEQILLKEVTDRILNQRNECNKKFDSRNSAFDAQMKMMHDALKSQIVSFEGVFAKKIKEMRDEQKKVRVQMDVEHRFGIFIRYVMYYLLSQVTWGNMKNICFQRKKALSKRRKKIRKFLSA